MADGQAWPKVHWGVIKTKNPPPASAQAPPIAHGAAAASPNQALFLEGPTSAARPAASTSPSGPTGDPGAQGPEILIAAASAEAKMLQALTVEPQAARSPGDPASAVALLSSGSVTGRSLPGFSRSGPPPVPPADGRPGIFGPSDHGRGQQSKVGPGAGLGFGNFRPEPG